MAKEDFQDGRQTYARFFFTMSKYRLFDGPRDVLFRVLPHIRPRSLRFRFLNWPFYDAWLLFYVALCLMPTSLNTLMQSASNPDFAGVHSKRRLRQSSKLQNVLRPLTLFYVHAFVSSVRTLVDQAPRIEPIIPCAVTCALFECSYLVVVVVEVDVSGS